MRGWGRTVLRLAVGTVFVVHGIQRLMPVWGWVPSPKVAAVASLGSFPEMWVALLDGAVGVFGGLALIAGAFVVPVAAVLIMERLWLLLTLRLPHGFFLNWALVPDVGHGYEYHLILIAALVCLIVEGPGWPSVDRYRRESAEVSALGRERLRSRGLT